jgi:hypothetical protein
MRPSKLRPPRAPPLRGPHGEIVVVVSGCPHSYDAVVARAAPGPLAAVMGATSGGGHGRDARARPAWRVVRQLPADSATTCLTSFASPNASWLSHTP